MSQSERHFIRQAVLANRSEKKNRATPKTIAPNTLVAAKATARSVSEVSIEPRMPARSNLSELHTHGFLSLYLRAVDEASTIAR